MAKDKVIYTPRSSEIWTFGLGKNEFVDLFGDLIPEMTQDESAKYISSDGSHACSTLDFFKIGGRMYELRNAKGIDGKNVESARKFIMNSMRDSYPNLQTRIAYLPKGENDEIIQNYGTQRATSKNVDLIGKDGKIEEVLSLEASLALTGKTSEETAEIMSYLNGNTPAYIWRFNSKPKQREERVVGLDAYSDRCNLYCDRVPQFAGASFRVSLAKKNFKS